MKKRIALIFESYLEVQVCGGEQKSNRLYLEV